MLKKIKSSTIRNKCIKELRKIYVCFSTAVRYSQKHNLALRFVLFYSAKHAIWRDAN